jgi:glycosyltransferase involved in cell wall biosynthesis
LAERIFKALGGDPRGLELILVDDGSTDDTWARISEIQRTEPRLRPLRHASSGGQSAALWTGFRAARGRIIATLDGDLQNDPGDLPRMLGELAEADLICGVRMGRQDNWLRRVSSRVARGARKLVFGVDFADTGCALRVFKSSLVEFIPPFNGFHRFLPVLAHGAGAVVKETPVAHHPRVAGQSKYGLWNRLGRGLYDLVGVRWFLKRQIRRTPPKPSSAGDVASKV